MQVFCDYCKQGIVGNYTISEGKNYHIFCFENHIQLKCSYCKHGITGQYLLDDWGNKVCGTHQLKQCSSCNRIIIDNTKLTLVNERYYCSNCMVSAINNTNALQSSYSKIISLFNQHGIQNVPATVPVNIVDEKTLRLNAKHVSAPNLRGFALTSYTRQGYLSAKIFSHTIYILSGMPLIEFESVLAHELLHTWLNQNEIKMSTQETEGFCNLGSYLVLSKANTKHASILFRSMIENPDINYGVGFRNMLKDLGKKGWHKLVSDVKGTKKSFW